MTFTRFLAGLLLAAPTLAQGQEPAGAATTPDAVARAAFEALAEMRWADVADLTHPEAMEQIRERTLQQLRMEARHRLEGPRPPRDRDMPPAVREWFQEQSRKAMERTRPAIERQYGLSSVAELEALSLRDFFARWVEAHDERIETRRLMEEGHPSLSGDPSLLDHLRPEGTVVGWVPEGDSLAQVLYRATGTSGIGRPGLRVLTLRSADDGWRLWPLDSGLDLFGPLASGYTIMRIAEVDLAEVAARQVVWPDDARPEGRARIVGFTSEDRPPRGLEVESVGPAGDAVRVEVPVAAFGDLVDIMTYWAHPR